MSTFCSPTVPKIMRVSLLFSLCIALLLAPLPLLGAPQTNREATAANAAAVKVAAAKVAAEKVAAAKDTAAKATAAKATAPETASASQRFITIDFDNVDILLFIKYISELTGRNFIIDRAVKGTVSIISPTKISEKDAYQVFESVLAVNGFTTVKAGVMTKIMPSVQARTENIDTLHHGRASSPEDKIVTQLIPLTHTTPRDMKTVLAPLVSKTSVVIAHTQSGILIVTDTLSNIQKLLSIIDALDVDYSSSEMEVLSLQHATASKMAGTITSIFKQVAPPQKGAPAGTTGVKVVPYERINAIIIMAGPGDLQRVKRLVAMLDTPPEHDEGDIHVLYLQHANAKELAGVLTSLPGQQKSKAKGAKETTPSISTDVKIMADEATNALIITSSRAEFKVLESVIAKLDIARRMVYLEALIMEVDTTSDFSVGVNWLGAGGFNDGTGGLLTGFGGADKFGGVSVDGGVGSGFSLGVLQQGIDIGGIVFPNIASLIKAYKNDATTNIIATPQILTTDNKKASIKVGENIPYLSQKNTADTSERGYESYEYKDVATSLSITPQINQANTLRLEISTEVNKVKGNSPGITPSTFTRSAETTVLVQDGQTIVIGGIIGHDADDGENKIPLLGDIPFIGWLFKTYQTKHVKQNMFIFITPHIIRNPADISRVTMDKETQLGRVMPTVKEELHKQVNLDNALTLSDIGFQKLQGKDYAAAKDYFNEALDVNPKYPYALMNMGVICEQEGDVAKAIDYYQQVVDSGIDEATGEENAGPNGLSLRNLCRENIKRLQGQQKTLPPSGSSVDDK